MKDLSGSAKKCEFDVVEVGETLQKFKVSEKRTVCESLKPFLKYFIYFLIKHISVN